MKDGVDLKKVVCYNWLWVSLWAVSKDLIPPSRSIFRELNDRKKRNEV